MILRPNNPRQHWKRKYWFSEFQVRPRNIQLCNLHVSSTFGSPLTCWKEMLPDLITQFDFPVIKILGPKRDCSNLEKNKMQSDLRASIYNLCNAMIICQRQN